MIFLKRRAKKQIKAIEIWKKTFYDIAKFQCNYPSTKIELYNISNKIEIIEKIAKGYIKTNDFTGVEAQYQQVKRLLNNLNENLEINKII